MCVLNLFERLAQMLPQKASYGLRNQSTQGDYQTAHPQGAVSFGSQDFGLDWRPDCFQPGDGMTVILHTARGDK